MERETGNEVKETEGQAIRFKITFNGQSLGKRKTTSIVEVGLTTNLALSERAKIDPAVQAPALYTAQVPLSLEFSVSYGLGTFVTKL